MLTTCCVRHIADRAVSTQKEVRDDLQAASELHCQSGCVAVAVTVANVSVCTSSCVPSSTVFRVCVSVCVCVRLCACGRACLSALQDEILEVLVFESPQVSWVNVAICFVSPLHDAKVWNSTLQSLNSSRGLWSCAESVESATRRVPCETICVSPPYCPVTLQFLVKTNGYCFGSTQAVAASQSSTAKAPLEERGNVVLPVLSEQVTEPPVIEDPLGSR